MSDTVPALSRVVVNPELIPRLLPLALLYAQRDDLLADLDEKMTKAAQDRAALVADFDAQAARLMKEHGIVFQEQAKSAATRGAGAVASVVDLATPRPDRPKAKRQKGPKRRAPHGANADRIYDLLVKNGPQRKRAFERLGISSSSFHHAIRKLQKEGLLYTTGKGHYMTYVAVTAVDEARAATVDLPTPKVEAALDASIEAVRAARKQDRRISPARFYSTKILEQLRYQNQDMDALSAALMLPPKRLYAPLSKLIRAGRITHAAVNGKTQYALAAGA